MAVNPNSDTKRNFERLALTYAILDKGWDSFTSIKSTAKSKFLHTIAVSSNDYVYSELQDWLFLHCPPKEQRSLIISTKRNNDSDLEVVDSKDSKQEYYPIKHVDTKSAKQFKFNGYKYHAVLSTPDKIDMKDGWRLSWEPEKIIISAYSKAAQESFFDLIKELIDKKQEGCKQVNLMTERYGDWRPTPLQNRSMESVFLPKEQKQRIVNDVKTFLDSERDYIKFNIPYHRGYLLYGPAGSGKTSFIKALAQHFKLDVHYVSLSEVKHDSKLFDLINSIEPKSILLLEDIDVLSVTNGRDGNESDGDELTLTGLLNALDGVATPHGLLVFMTTNSYEKLDPALIRSGRADIKELFDNCTTEQVLDSYHYFYGEPLTNFRLAAKVSVSDVMEVYKKHMYDKVGAEKGLRRL